MDKETRTSDQLATLIRNRYLADPEVVAGHAPAGVRVFIEQLAVCGEHGANWAVRVSGDVHYPGALAHAIRHAQFEYDLEVPWPGASARTM